MADDKTAADRAVLEAAIFDDGSRALAGALAPDANLGISRNEGSLMLAFSHLAQRAIEDVYADCGDTDAGVLSSNVGQYIAREVHEVLFGEPDGVLRDGAAVRRVAPDRETLAATVHDWNTPSNKPGPKRKSEPNQMEFRLADALLASGVLGVPAEHPVGNAYDPAREQIAQAIYGSWQVIDLGEADLNKSRIMADGVLWRFGVPADQRTADRETIARAIWYANVADLPFNEWDRRHPDQKAPIYKLADAVLAVLVPADQVRAETLRTWRETLHGYTLNFGSAGELYDQIRYVLGRDADTFDKNAARATEPPKVAGA